MLQHATAGVLHEHPVKHLLCAGLHTGSRLLGTETGTNSSGPPGWNVRQSTCGEGPDADAASRSSAAITTVLQDGAHLMRAWRSSCSLAVTAACVAAGMAFVRPFGQHRRVEETCGRALLSFPLSDVP